MPDAGDRGFPAVGRIINHIGGVTMEKGDGKAAGLTTQPKVKNPLVLKRLVKDCQIGLITMKDVLTTTGVKINDCLNYGIIPEFPSDFCARFEALLLAQPHVVDWLKVEKLQIGDVWSPQNPKRLTTAAAPPLSESQTSAVADLMYHASRSMPKAARAIGPRLSIAEREKNPMVLKKLAKDCGISLYEIKGATGATLVSIKTCLDSSLIPSFPSDFCEVLETHLLQNPKVRDWLTCWQMTIKDIWEQQYPNLSAENYKSAPPILKQLAQDCRFDLEDFAVGSGWPLEMISRYVNEGIYDPKLCGFEAWVEDNLTPNKIVADWLSARALNIDDIWNPLTTDGPETVPAYSIPSILKRMCTVSGSQNDAELERFLGTVPGKVTTYREDGTMPSSFIIQLAELTGTSLDWLILGKGSAAFNNKKDPQEETGGSGLFDAMDIVGSAIGMVSFMDTALCALNRGDFATSPKTDDVKFGMSNVFMHIQEQLRAAQALVQGQLKARSIDTLL
jgi:hypothetical protein